MQNDTTFLTPKELSGVEMVVEDVRIFGSFDFRIPKMLKMFSTYFTEEETMAFQFE